MPDILTNADKSYAEIYRESLKALQDSPHTVYSNRYYCLKVGYVWRGVNERKCRYCNASLSEKVSKAVPDAKTGVQSDSGAGIGLPEPPATPETITITLPALRAVILGVIDDGDPTTTLNPSVLPAMPWAIDHSFQDVANDARLRFCDEIERRLRQLPAGG